MPVPIVKAYLSEPELKAIWESLAKKLPMPPYQPKQPTVLAERLGAWVKSRGGAGDVRASKHKPGQVYYELNDPGVQVLPELQKGS